MSTRPHRNIATPRRRRARRGYVLIVALAVLVLSAGLLVALGRSAMRHAALAREARDDLQRRWGAASCRSAVLPVAEQALAAEEGRRGGPVPSVRAAVRLGGVAFELTLADEQAKADVNALLADAVDVSTAESRLRQALAGYGLANKVRLRPAPKPAGGTPPVGRVSTSPPAAAAATGPASRPGGWRPIVALGQVLDGVPPADWLRPPGGGQTGDPPAALLTCFGDGAVNVRRAPESVLRLALSPPLSAVEVGRVLEQREQLFYAKDRAPGLSLAAAARSARDRTPANRSPVRRLVEDAGLTAVGGRLLPRMKDGSTCHSLWVVADDGRRRWYTLTVLDRSGPAEPRTYSFAW